MPETHHPRSSSWFSKFIECLVSWLIAAQLFFWMLDTLIARYLNNYNQGQWLGMFINISWIFVVIAIGSTFWWHAKEKRGKLNSALIHAWLRGALRYFLAYAISIYGFAKILRTQFATSYFRSDMLTGNMSGFELTWSYFGYSYTFAVILGLIQIGGSILLLFRRTNLLGVCILLPVMVNIVFINLFYHIAFGAFINSLFYTFGLIYLLLLRFKELKALFLTDVSGLPPIRLGFFKPVIKLLVIAAAFGVIYHYVSIVKPAAFTGKWKVEQLLCNGKIVDDNTRQNDKMLWRNIYMEEAGMMEISTNPDYFEPKNAKWASYSYDADKHNLRLIFSVNGALATDTTNIAVSNYDGKSMQWNIMKNGDLLQLKLSKVTYESN